MTTPESNEPTITAFAPGRVNLIGEHTDYTGGLVLPLALDLGITVTGTRGGQDISLQSATESLPARLPVSFEGEPTLVEPPWGRFLGGLLSQLGPVEGFEGTVETTLPTGGTGLSSSSALTVACLLALAGDGDRVELAKTARLAEIAATGVNCGMMDQLASLCSQAGHALLIDCRDFSMEPVAIPDSMEILVVHTGQSRELADSAYNERRASCEEIEKLIGPLRDASVDDVAGLADPTLRRRGRHVVSENERVLELMAAFAADDPRAAGEVLASGHRSLADDYEVSTAIVDEMVSAVAGTPGVFGARLTGGGFGGSMVALCAPGTELSVPTWWQRVRPAGGATLVEV